MNDARLPFGVAELVTAVAGAERILDAGCGSGRLTVALARTGADVVGFDKSAAALSEARARVEEAGVALELVPADLEQPLPFPDGRFDAVVSRLVLMIPSDPVAALRELARTLRADGVVATALWAALEHNPWFAEPRAALEAVVGSERAAFARAFGRLGSTSEAATVHRRAGLIDVETRLLEETVERADAREHWRLLAAENGHFRRADAMLDDATRAAVLEELGARLARYRAAGGSTTLHLPRTLVLVTARHARN